MRFSSTLAIVALTAHLAGCPGTSTYTDSTLSEDYAPRFAGVWTGMMTASAGGITDSWPQQLSLVQTGTNQLSVADLYAGCNATAYVTGPSSFGITPVVCSPNGLATCPSTLSIDQGEGSLASGVLELRVAGVMKDCNSRRLVSLAFTATLPDRPPTVTVVLSPADPKVTDPIVATIDATDPDGDAVTLTVAWTLNGSPLPDQTATTLPAGIATNNDVVGVKVTASDGTLAAGAEATVTVAKITITGDVPARVALGEPVSVQLSLSGAEPPPGGFALEFGPAGMQVTADGLVTWTPDLPTFGADLNVAFGVRLAGAPRVRLVDSIVVSKPGGEGLRFRGGFDPPSGHAALLVKDLDGDGRAEILIASSSGLYEVVSGNGGYVMTWSYPYAFTDPPLALAAADMNGDGMAEIFYSTAKKLVRIDGASRREVASAPLPNVYSSWPGSDLQLADIDGDGALELVCLLGDHWGQGSGVLVVIDAATLAVKWQSPSLDNVGGAVAIGNVDHDAALEVVTSGGYVFDGATKANEWHYTGGFGAQVGTGDLDGDGVDEIVGMQSWDTFRGYSAVLKSPLWEKGRFNSGSLHVADVDGDHKAEVIIGDAQWGDVSAFKYDAATNTLATLFDVAKQGQVLAVSAGDVDGDGAVEIVWSGTAMLNTDFGARSLFVAGLSGTIEWMAHDPAQLDGFFMGARPVRRGALGDRVAFAVPWTNNSYAGGRLLFLDPATATFDLSAEMDLGYGVFDVADGDGDGVDELWLGSSEGYGRYLSAYDTATGLVDWQSAILTELGPGAAAVVAADVDGDGAREAVELTTDGHVVIYDPASQALVWTSVGIGRGVGLATADLDHDGALEIVALSTGRLVVYRAGAGAIPWLEAASVALDTATDLLVADCDGDGTVEIYALTRSWSLSGSTVTRFDAALAQTASWTLKDSVASLHVEDLASGRKNLVLGVAGDYYSTAGFPPYLMAVDASSGRTIWRSPGLHGYVPRSSLAYVDVTGQGARSLVFGTEEGVYVAR